MKKLLERGHFAIVEFLMKDSRLILNSKDIYGYTPFHYACINGLAIIIEFLLTDSRLKINTRNNYGHIDVVKILLKDARLEINSQDEHGWSHFHNACLYEDNKIISLFLNANRKIDLDIESTQEYKEYPIATSGYDILRDKNIVINTIKEKISKNQKLIFYAADGDLLELKNLIQRKKIKF